jgi:hypothetical protein
MWGWFRVIFNGIRGWFNKRKDRLRENETVIAGTFDAAIKKRQQRYETVKEQVALLVGHKRNITNIIKGINESLEKQKGIKTGTQAAMQKRLDQLKEKGKSKDEIVADAEFMKHKAAYEHATASVLKEQARLDEKTAELDKFTQQIEQYKIELQEMQRANEELAHEKNATIADVTIAKQQEEIAAALNGIPQDSTDEELAGVRAARNRVVEKAQISKELAGNDASVAEQQYLNLANSTKTSTELDSLLDWGEEKKEDPLAPAKLPETPQ